MNGRNEELDKSIKALTGAGRGPYRLLVLDIDGTLLGKDGKLSPRDCTALAQARAHGIRVALSTGRALYASLRIINELELDGYHVFFDGALVSDSSGGTEVYAAPLEQGLVLEAVDYAHRLDVNLELFSTSRYFAEKRTWISEIRDRFFHIQPCLVDFNRLCREERIIKGTLVLNSDEDRARYARFRRRFEPRFSFTLSRTPAYPDVDFINITGAGVSKGTALKALAGHMDIPLSQIMAIGDGDNDMTLLAAAGLAVAMGNAPDELKQVADAVTFDVDHAGVAAAIERFLL